MDASSLDDRRTIKLYSPDGVGIAAFIGSLPAGAILLASNYRKLRDPAAARKTLWYGLLGTVGLLLFAILVRQWSTHWTNVGLEVGITVSMYHLAKQLQGAAYEEHIRHGGLRASNWRAAGIGVVSLLGLLMTLFAGGLFLVIPIWGGGPSHFSDERTGFTVTRPLGWVMDVRTALQQTRHSKLLQQDAPFELIATLVRYTPVTLHKRAVVKVFRYDLHRFPSGMTAHALLQQWMLSMHQTEGQLTTVEFGGHMWEAAQMTLTRTESSPSPSTLPTEIYVTVGPSWAIGIMAMAPGESSARSHPLIEPLLKQISFKPTSPLAPS